MVFVKNLLSRFRKDKMRDKRYFLNAEIKFDSAHRLSNYKGKCSNLHGHTYRVIITVSSNKLNNWGAVMDFGKLKHLLKEKVDEKYDHKTILYIGDKENQVIGNVLTEDAIAWMNSNPTAENMAREIFQDLVPSIKAERKNIKLEVVAVYETETNVARYSEDYEKNK